MESNMRKLNKKLCLNCSKEFNFFSGSKGETKKRKFCSSKCNGNFYAQKLSEERRGIGNPMFGKKPWNYDYEKERIVCKQLKMPRPKRGKVLGFNVLITKSGSRRQRYYDVKTGKGYKKLHRILMEKHLGRELSSDEIVHHVDGNGLNNNINNLTIMSRSEHSKVHKVNNNFGGGVLK